MIEQKLTGGVPSITAAQTKRHTDIAAQIEEFRSKGGNIELIDRGVSGETRPGPKKYNNNGRIR